MFKWGLARWMSWAKMEFTSEVYGLFAAYINQRVDMSVKKRQSLIPDFAISFAAGRPRQLGELKFIGQSEKFFPSDKIRTRGAPASGRGRGRSTQTT